MSDDEVDANQRQMAARLGEEGIDHDLDTTMAISTIFRTADIIRNHMERVVLSDANLSFTAFTVLWVLWIWGDQEARHVADRAGISRGTLTGVVGTLEGRDLVVRLPHPSDKRSVIVSLTAGGNALISTIFPRFHAEEVRISSALTAHDKASFSDSMRAILNTIASLDAE